MNISTKLAELKCTAEMNEAQNDELFNWYKTLNKDEAIAFWFLFARDCRTLSEVWFRSNPEYSKYILKMFVGPEDFRDVLKRTGAYEQG